MSWMKPFSTANRCISSSTTVWMRWIAARWGLSMCARKLSAGCVCTGSFLPIENGWLLRLLTPGRRVLVGGRCVAAQQVQETWDRRGAAEHAVEARREQPRPLPRLLPRVGAQLAADDQLPARARGEARDPPRQLRALER